MSFFTVKVLAWIAGALGVVIIGMGVALWAQGVQLGYMENQRDKANQQLSQAKLTIQGFESAVKQCNEATAKLKYVSDEKAAAADAALLRARKEGERHQASNKRLAQLVAAPTLAGATCVTALAAVRRELRK